MRTSQSTLFSPSPWCLGHGMREHVIVNRYHTGLQLCCHPSCMGSVGREHTCGKCQVSLICQRNSLFIIIKRNDWQNRTKRFFIHNFHMWCTASHHRSWVEEPFGAITNRLTLCHDLGSAAERLLHLFLYRFKLFTCGH
uniref:Uncharacterized protein n=1 Tax=Lygus hesperus TaxID=30085 RepID=A0A146L6C3_LYGHE